jgi:pimeloyl-ACP methyl ester carboxylesterase
MIETTTRFGNESRLLGILSSPDRQLLVGKRPAVIFLNAGLLHRVGPYRLHVEAARRLSLKGFASFRIDISGIGDSEASSGCDEYEKNAMTDAKAAMDYVEAKTGISSFVLFGLCAGADNAHNIAVMDPRIAGSIFLDGYGYPTLWFKVRDYAPGLLKPHKWIKYLKRFTGTTTPVKEYEGPSGKTMIDVFGRNWPSKSITEQELALLVQRGVELLFVYSGGVPVYYNYRNQFRDMFSNVDFKAKLRLEYFKNADHTYTLLEQREKLLQCVCKWMADKFGKGTGL